MNCLLREAIRYVIVVPYGLGKGAAQGDDGAAIWADLGVTALIVQFKVNLPEDSFHSYRCDGPSTEVEVTKDDLVHMYKQMVRDQWPWSGPY
jgi:hypothetical protein